VAFLRNKPRQEVLSAYRKLLSPLIELLLRSGISAGDFTALAKAVYVHVAAEQLALTARRINQSRIAIVTGLTRAEVKRLLRSPVGYVAPRQYELHRAERVIRGWCADAEFSTGRARPLRLPIRGRVGSFTALVKKYSGDIPVRAMLDQLVAMRAVKIGANSVRMSNPFAPSSGIDREQVNRFGEHIENLGRTLLRNMDANIGQLYVGTAVSVHANAQLVGLLRERLTHSAQHFLSAMDDQLQTPPKHKRQGRKSQPPVRLGVTVFVHEREYARRSRENKSRKR
jgi:hypothetical protein